MKMKPLLLLLLLLELTFFGRAKYIKKINYKGKDVSPSPKSSFISLVGVAINDNNNNNLNYNVGSSENHQTGNNSSINSNGDNKKSRIFNIKFNFVESFCKKFLSLFLSDLDIIRISSKIVAWIIWIYIGLSTLGTLGFGI